MQQMCLCERNIDAAVPEVQLQRFPSTVGLLLVYVSGQHLGTLFPTLNTHQPSLM